jgi:hypothetical protein
MHVEMNKKWVYRMEEIKFDYGDNKCVTLTKIKENSQMVSFDILFDGFIWFDKNGKESVILHRSEKMIFPLSDRWFFKVVEKLLLGKDYLKVSIR